jgi:hypothetical protein
VREGAKQRAAARTDGQGLRRDTASIIGPDKHVLADAECNILLCNVSIVTCKIPCPAFIGDAWVIWDEFSDGNLCAEDAIIALYCFLAAKTWLPPTPTKRLIDNQTSAFVLGD